MLRKNKLKLTIIKQDMRSNATVFFGNFDSEYNRLELSYDNQKAMCMQVHNHKHKNKQFNKIRYCFAVSQHELSKFFVFCDRY